MHAVSALLLLAACGNDQGLSRLDVPVDEPSQAALTDLQFVDRDPVVGSAESWGFDEATGISRETLYVGEGSRTDRVDLLWVIDDSVSMAGVLDQVYAGLGSVIDEGEYLPGRMRMAVMHMSPGDGETRRPHAAARQRTRGPGFLKPVQTQCRPWFRPEETSEDGTSCLEAHTELRLANRRTEAGLTALKHALEHAERKGTPLFRTGAAVNVVFVSDTHDPGFSVHRDKPRRSKWFADLVSMRPDFAQLSELAFATHDLASFRVHSIAPDTECTQGERWEMQIGPVYHLAAEAAEGVTADICTETDYVAVIEDILATAPVRQTTVTVLEELDADIIEVRLDGALVDYREQGGVLELDVNPSERGKLEVYRRMNQAVWE